MDAEEPNELDDVLPGFSPSFRIQRLDMDQINLAIQRVVRPRSKRHLVRVIVSAMTVAVAAAFAMMVFV